MTNDSFFLFGTSSWDQSGAKFRAWITGQIWKPARLHFVFLKMYSLTAKLPIQSNSVTQSCPTLCDPMDCSIPGFLVHHPSQSLLKLMFIELVMPSSHLISCVPFSSCLQSFPESGSFQIKWNLVIISPCQPDSGKKKKISPLGPDPLSICRNVTAYLIL